MFTSTHTHRPLQSYSSKASVHIHWALSKKLQGSLSLSNTPPVTLHFAAPSWQPPSPSRSFTHIHTRCPSSSWAAKHNTYSHTHTQILLTTLTWSLFSLCLCLSLPVCQFPLQSAESLSKSSLLSEQIIHFPSWTHKRSHSFHSLLPHSSNAPPVSKYLSHQIIFPFLSILSCSSSVSPLARVCSVFCCLLFLFLSF